MELIFSENGDILSAFDQEGVSVLWDMVTGARLRRTQCQNFGHYLNLIDAEVTEDGRLTAVACNDAYVVQPRDRLDTDTILHTLAEGLGGATGVAFNPEGTILATSTDEGAVTLWDMETGKERLTLADRLVPQGRDEIDFQGGFGLPSNAKNMSISGVDFSPDGRYLAAAGSDGTVHVYIMSLEELMEIARSRLSRDFTQEECRTYLSLDKCVEES